MKGAMDERDFICPICLELLVQPVVMPCSHELCMLCFKTHVEKTSLCCPICRIRISNWARRKAKEGKLVDQERWNQIQKLFPERCKRRLRGEDDNESYFNGSWLSPIIAENGTLRKEYEEELLKIELEKEEGLKASEEIARKMHQEELEMDELLLKDGEMAKQLQFEELEKVGGKVSSFDTKLKKYIEKLPNDRTLRSTVKGKFKIKSKQKVKVTTGLTNWLSKAYHDKL